MEIKKYALLVLLLIPLSCSNHFEEQGMSQVEKANYFLKNMLDDSDTPGLQYIIVDSNSTIFEFNEGLSNLENDNAISHATTFHAFSVTKTFTALAILQLEEEKKLSIEDPAQLYLDYLPFRHNFSIHQLLNHTSGLPNPIPMKWIHLMEEHGTFNYKEFVNNVLTENNELDQEPGEKYKYSNIGYLLLGEIIENVTGVDYRAYIKNKIIHKLKLSNDEYLDFKLPDTLTHARGYIKKWSFLNVGLNFVFDKSKYLEDTYDGWNQFKYYYMNGYPFGGLIGNTRGFAKYLQLFLKENEQISNNIKLKLFGTQNTNNSDTLDMCLSWFRGSLEGEQYFAHAGGGGGYYCEIRVYPKKNLASVIMFNRTGVSDERFLDKVDRFFIN